MNEANELHYNRKDFPFYEVLDELTDWSLANEADPLETYLRYCRLRRDTRLTPCPDYASTSITSGGHARRPDLDIYSVINANTGTARRILMEMSRQGSMDARGTILPVDLGYLPHWQQSDYMHFWSLVISGPDLGIRHNNHSAGRYRKRFTKKLDKKLVDVDKMNDSMLSAEERAIEYFKYADAFAGSVGEDLTDASPARSVVSLIDPELSLGCQTERLLAKMLEIPVRRLVAVRLIDSYTEALSDYKLREDLDNIVRFGGTVVRAAKGSMLTMRTVQA